MYKRQGDRLIVESIDRLGRNYEEIIQTVNYLNCLLYTSPSPRD
ncbi:hypothetical protein JMUB7538_27360 [Staphylococcus aureus]